MPIGLSPRWGCALFALLLSAAPSVQARVDVDIVYLTRSEQPRQPLSLLDAIVEDDGIQGARLGLKDSQTTGTFLNHFYQLEHIVIDESADLVSRFRDLVAAGKQLFIADLGADDLRALTAAAQAVLIFNVRAKDDLLRNEACDPNLLHVPPSRAMIADALAQYLAWKRWQRLILVTGRHPEDQAYTAAIKRAAKRYGLKVIGEKNWTAEPGARRTDSGHHNLQQEVPAFTQFDDHDVLIVADERDEFGEYLPYRSTRPRPVAGTHGLQPTAWHRTQEQWGATQIQRRFGKLAGRWMTERDYAAWAAVRSIGEAVTNTGSNQAAVLREFLLSDRFKLAGFKGVPLTYRRWNGQLRQPVLVAAPRMLVTVSPQKGFLHQYSVLDTLGYDQPESSCDGF